MLKPFLYFYLFVLMISGCTKTEASSQDANLRQPELTLNKGRKWQINEAQKLKISVMQGLLLNYAAGTKGPQELWAELENANGELLKICLVKNEAQRMLHAWQIPFMMQLDMLKTAETDAEVRTAVAELNNSLLLYEKYFE